MSEWWNDKEMRFLLGLLAVIVAPMVTATACVILAVVVFRFFGIPIP